MQTIINALGQLYQTSSQTCLLLAPAGQGKTSLTIELFTQFNLNIFFVSPLRALAQELAERMQSMQLPCFCPTSMIEAEVMMKKISKHDSACFSIITPETFCDEWWSTPAISRRTNLIVIDECHLFFYWGDHFRPRLLEFLDAVSNTQNNLLFLTATLAQPLKERLQQFMFPQRPNLLLIDLGNQQILRPPHKICYLPTSMIPNILWSELDWHGRHSQCVIIFCRYRHEVLQWERSLCKAGLQVLSCLGGEAVAFREKLKKCPNPEVIVATSVLGHGVNLPPCHLVVMTYDETNPDLALQMLARGGRRGEKYWCLRPWHHGHWHWRIFLTCLRDLTQCTLGIFYGWLFYPNARKNHERTSQHRRPGSQKNALSGEASSGDFAIAPRQTKNHPLLRWSRWRQNAKGLRP